MNSHYKALLLGSCRVYPFLYVLTAALGSALPDPAKAQTLTTLYNFTAAQNSNGGVYTNSDGASPQGGLVVSGNALYGVTSGGGNSGDGTVFAIDSDGSNLSVLLNRYACRHETS